MAKRDKTPDSSSSKERMELVQSNNTENEIGAPDTVSTPMESPSPSLQQNNEDNNLTPPLPNREGGEPDPQEEGEGNNQVPQPEPPNPPIDPPSWTIDPNATPLNKFISYKVPHIDDYGLNGGLMLGEFCIKCPTPAQYPILDKWLLDCALD